MTNVVLPDDEVFQRFLAAADDTDNELNADQVAIDIVARILKADSVDAVLEGSSATHARDYLEQPFTLTGVRFNRSSLMGEGPAFYALLEGADKNGEKVAITCGAKNVIAQAWRLNDLGALPLAIQIKESPNPTAAGFRVMWLEKAPASF